MYANYLIIRLNQVFRTFTLLTNCYFWIMNPRKTYSVDEALKKLENYCAYQDRCHQEVEQKLFDMGMISQAKEKIILHLIEQTYLNEERFAKAYVRGKFRI